MQFHASDTRIKSVSPAVDSYIDEGLLRNIMESIRSDGLPRPIRVKYDSNTHPPDRPFTVVDDDLLFRAAERITRENPARFKVLSCDVIDPDEVIVAGTSQKLVMTWHTADNQQIESLALPNLRATTEGRVSSQ